MKSRAQVGRERRFLHRAHLCHALGITPNKHASWRDDGLLEDTARPDMHDAVELAVLARVTEVAGPRRGKRAWRKIRSPLRKHDPRSRRSIWVVIDRDLERDALALSASELATHAALEAPIWVVPLRPVIGEAKRAFEKHARFL